MIPLHVRSHYSFLDGASSVEALVARAKELRLPALALTDRDGTYGAVRFWRAAKAAGLTPLIGAEVGGVTLLTRGRKGWSNLCTILSRKHLGQPYDMAELQEGLHVIAGDLATARALRGRIDQLWLEWVRPGRSATGERDRLESGFPLVASSDVHFARPEDFRAHRVLSAIRENVVLPQLAPTCDPGNHLRDLRPLFADVPEALANAERIAADCAWEFLPAPVTFPSYDAPDPQGDREMREDREIGAGDDGVAKRSSPRLPGSPDPHHVLRSLCGAGMFRRYGDPPPEAWERLERELAVIRKLGFTEYFLVVHDIVRAARMRRAPIAGRGSGASSLVAYVLGITNVCPLRYGLQFERFLHEGRTDWPDLDLDFCWRTRDEVIDHVFHRFGAERVAMVSTHIALRERGAFREAAKAHGFSEDQIRAIRRALPVELEESLGGIPDRWRRRCPVDPDRVNTVLEDARRIAGAPSHVSVHCGGVVIARGPIERITPLQRAEKGVVISQFDKDGVEAIGLVKIDLLGNRAVSTIQAATDLVARLDGYPLDVEAIPDGDLDTVRLLREGRTIGVNQMESPAMRHLLRQARPGGIEGVMQALALIRPGAAGEGMKDAFVRRVQGLESWSVDSRLENVLGDSFGVMLYEDDAMLVAAALAGWTLAEGERFRKRLRKEPEGEALRKEFLGACAAAGTPAETARNLWAQMAKFTGYTFCKSHAASYAQLAYAATWLKAHHPAAFWVAALNNNQGMYEKRVYVEEARRDGMRTLLPCVNRSEREFAAEGNEIRIGLGLVAGLSANASDSILAARPFESLQDFLRRAEIDFPEAKALVKCGAFDFLGRPRPELLLDLTATRKLVRSGTSGRLKLPKIPDVDEPTKRRWEFEILGMCPSEHLMKALWPGLGLEHVTNSSELPRCTGQQVRVAGVLDALRMETTRSGPMQFLTLEDEEGVFEVTVFPAAYRRCAEVVRGAGPYLVTGRVEDRYGAVAVNAERVHLLHAP
ncbi:MAG: DNA polymerase III subunit alpha [Planctomycetes bacterium]|nr:DNA polymerase III subunit alpha [Planctomycetota bacterium]